MFAKTLEKEPDVIDSCRTKRPGWLAWAPVEPVSSRPGLIRLVEGMPAGTVGVEAVGKVTEDDYRDVLVPAVTRALVSKDVRLLPTHWVHDGVKVFFQLMPGEVRTYKA
jgi:hypothetical protein